MHSDMVISGKDSLKLNILQEVISGQIELKLKLDTNAAQDYAVDIRREGSRMCVYGGFNLSEDSAGGILTIRPAVEGHSLKIAFRHTAPTANGKVSVFRRATKRVEQEYDITDSLSCVELIPREDGQYALQVSYAGCAATNVQNTSSPPVQPAAADGELARLESDMEVQLQGQDDWEQRQQNALDYRAKLERIEAEYQKDYSALTDDIEEMKSRMKADAAVVEYYKDRDITPIETLFDEINAKLDEAEVQIRLFIEAKQRKTMEIESAIKSDKRQ